MPPPVIQVVQERWFPQQQAQAPQQFSYEKPNLPPREKATQWESMTAPVQNPMEQVVGDLMQQGVEPTEMQGLSARELASIRDALTNDKVAVDTQTEKTTNFPVSTQTWESPKIPSMTMGTQIGDDVGTELSTFKSTSTFGGQTEPPQTQSFSGQTDTPGFNTIGTQLGRTPMKKPVPLLPPVPKVPTRSRPTLSSSETISLFDIPPKPYTEMSTEELKVAVQYKGVKGAQNLNKAQLQAVLQSDNPATTAAVLVRGKMKDSEMPDANITGIKRRPYRKGSDGTSTKLTRVSLD
jgi:hypothetical protein